MQTSVMFNMLMTLLEKRRVTRQFFAEKYEMSIRTVSRYMDCLAAAGIPVFATRGPKGGYYVPDEYVFDSTFFSVEELSRLITCVKSIDGFNDNLNPMILDKLEHLSANKSDKRFLLSTDTLIIDAGSWHNPGLYRKKIDVINRAIQNNVSLSLVYTDRHEAQTQRLFDPYFIVLKEGIWYTYGWCHIREDLRLFKLARIHSILATEKPFERRDSDVYEKLKGNFDDCPLIDIELEFSSTITGDIEEWLGAEAIFERDTKLIAGATLYSGRQLINKLLSFGSSIKVLHPSFLREELLVECRRILRYAGELD